MTSTTAHKKVPLAESGILRQYAERTPGSARLYRRAQKLFPSGVTHLGRYLEPHPLFVSRASGSSKWDVDGTEYVDYFGGHGALMLGHSHPVVVEAVTAQLARGTHYGASHELELEWAELIQQMIPSAQRIRFTSSGTEATMLALRMARAFTDKPVLLRFAGHFHGWHDHVAFGADLAPGILKEIAANVVLCPPHDLAYVKQVCESRQDIAAVILEPTGATFGHVPIQREFLVGLRELTARHGVVLIFDEVVTGFRCSPGGAQGHYKITPDLTTLAKVVAGGYPGAAVAGRADILETMEYHHSAQGIQLPAIPHQGTFNASPLSAAAGIATLRLLRDGTIIAKANETAAAIRDGMNGMLRRLGLGWSVYGDFSDFHVYPGSSLNPADPASVEDIRAGKVAWNKLKGGTPAELQQKVRAGFLAFGVDVIGWPGGVVSGIHGEDDVDRTVSAFEKVLGLLAEEGELG